MEATATHDPKVASDSAYSISCNSQSQRSGSGCGSGSTRGSSKSHRSGSSGSSSGYCGQPSTLSSGNETFPQPKFYKRNKVSTEHKKKKKQKMAAGPAASPAAAEKTATTTDVAMTAGAEFGGNCGAEEAAAVPAVPGQEMQPLLVETTQGAKKSGMELSDVPEENDLLVTTSPQNFSSEMKAEQIPSNMGTELKVQIPETTEFCVVVSMEDGIVVHTSHSLERILGVPKNMWIGRSFIEFVHAKDHAVFASNVAAGVVAPLTPNPGARARLALKNMFFSRLRCYGGLAAAAAAGLGLHEARDAYLPFQLTTTLREVGKAPAAGHDYAGKSIFLVIAAKLVQSVYKYAEEVRALPKFITKHLASCELSHVDAEAVPHLGYLPQDLIGRSVMDFYHPEDLPYLKEVYLTVLKEKEPIFRSRPYRFRVQNGTYVLLETEWSSFINPWTMKLEFVTGQHQALVGPADPDVFRPPPRDRDGAAADAEPDEVVQVKQEIRWLLAQTIARASETVRVHAANRCKNLADFMHTLLDEPAKPAAAAAAAAAARLARDDAPFFAERDSVMLGEISPHHDHDATSKSSTETPPSYTQLNYKENIQRFFESKPKTSASDANPSLPSTDEEGKSLQVADSSLGSITATNRNHSSAVNDSGSGSGSRQSSGSNEKGGTSADSRGHASQTKAYAQGHYKKHHLTEAVLYRHNEDMEKEMSKKHRENREHWGKIDRGKKSTNNNVYKLFQQQCQGMKRSRSHSWEAAPCKHSKRRYADGARYPAAEAAAAQAPAAGAGDDASACQRQPGVNLWPPFSVGVPAGRQLAAVANPSFAGACLAAPTSRLDLIPVYLIPSQHPGLPPTDGRPTDRGGHAHVPPRHAYVNPGVVFRPLNTVYGAPILYPSMTMRRPDPNDAPHKPQPSQKTFSDTRGTQRALSQATSLKAEPGSGVGSIASASVIRCTLSECSKKALPLFSPLGQASSNVSHDGHVAAAPKQMSAAAGGYNEASSCSALRDQSTQDGSCFSSFYSFLRSGKSDGSAGSSLDDSRRSNRHRWGRRESKTKDIGESARPVLQEPAWLEKVTVTPDLVYRYQIANRSLDSVLAVDLERLDSVRQPALVNEQLCQFYADMELEGLTTRLALDEGLTSSGASSGEEAAFVAVQRQPLAKNKKKRRRSFEYGKLTMVFEENAPIPPPVC